MRLALTGGGTGGHIYPGLAVIEALQARDPDSEILWIGSEKGLEAEILPKRGIPFAPVPAAPWKGDWLRRSAVAFTAFRGVLAARRALEKFRPDAVLSTGGWVSVPAGLAARSLGIPLYLHESNAHPGLANRFLARFAKKILLAWELTGGSPFPPEKTEVVGLPLRGAVGRVDRRAARERLGIPFRAMFLLVFGGSRGARRINEAMAGAVWGLAEECEVAWATGKDLYDETVEALGGAGHVERFARWGVRISPYIEEMPWLLAAADLVVSRCGAVTTAEIAASGVPSILVPYPFAAEAHQEANARLLAERGAGVLLRDEDLTPRRLFVAVREILGDPERREKMSRAAKAFHTPGAAERILAVLGRR